MKIPFKLPACLLCFCLVAATASAQVDTLVNRFSDYRAQRLEERIYVHTDRSFYICGEILWFKVYAVSGPLNRPDDLSKIAYLEVLDKENKPVLQARVALEGGSGSGSLDIPFSLSSGNYRLRAYTRWMRNFPPEYYFEKQLTIVNTAKVLPREAVPAAGASDGDAVTGDAPAGNTASGNAAAGDAEPWDATAGNAASGNTTAGSAAASFDLQFFPEGGDLVEGLRSRVAFKLTDRRGKGVEFSGIITAGNGDTIATIRPLKYGMGSFYLVPSAAEGPYTAIVRTGSGETFSRELPKARENGYVMHLEEKEGGITVTVNGSEPSSPAPVYLFVHTRQQIRLAEMKKPEAGRAVFRLEKDKLGEGVSHFTVFNASLRPVAERLYFRRPAKRLFIKPSAVQSVYHRRSEVKLEIAALDAEGKGLPADMSVAVYRLDSLEDLQQADIFASLWLSSDLAGRIEDPGYYMEATGKQASQALDNLMLTHGWRRFKWDEVLQSPSSPVHFAPEYKGHIIMGRVTDAETGRPAANVMTYLSVPGRQVRLQASRSDGEGQVRFEMKAFYGPSEIVAQTGTDSTLQVQIANPFSERYVAAALPLFGLEKAAANALRLRSKAMQVQKTYYGPGLRQFRPSTADSAPFYYRPDKTYLLDDYVRFTTMEEVMREYVPEVIVRKRGGEFRFLTMNIPVFRMYGNSGPDVFFNSDPLVLLDGVPVFDIDRIVAYDPLKVERLEIVGSRYLLGPLAAAGIVSYTTYKGNLEGFGLDPGSVIIDYDGLQLQREFYAPDYGDRPPSSPLPDFRNLLFWSPAVYSTGQDSNSVSFYTSDIPGNYQVFVQGITPGGDAGSGSFRFRVTE